MLLPVVSDGALSSDGSSDREISVRSPIDETIPLMAAEELMTKSAEEPDIDPDRAFVAGCGDMPLVASEEDENTSADGASDCGASGLVYDQVE